MTTIFLDRKYKPWMAADKEATGHRKALAGVGFDPSGHAAAADGFCLAVVPCEFQADDEPDCGQVLIRAEFLRFAAQHAAYGKHQTALPLHIHDDVVEVKTKFGSLAEPLMVTEKPFPNWRALIPDVRANPVSPVLHYDMALVNRVASAIGSTRVHVFGAREATPIVVASHSDSAFGFVMPLFLDTAAAWKKFDEIWGLRPQEVTA
jgi:hypothetical protein